jgi:hypothetical protein
MYQIDSIGSVAALPAPAAAGTPGFFDNGNPATATQATILDGDFFNAVMMELINIVIAAGIAPAKGTNNQVLDAIQQLIGAVPKGLGASATYGGTPTSGTPTLYEKIYTPFVAPSNGVVSGTAYANMGGGAAQPGAVQNLIQIVGSVSGTFTSSDTTKLPMTNCVVAHVVAGETVTVTSFANSDGTAQPWNSIGGGSSYVFIPTP